MKVYALVGKSGTGKSYQAMNLCRAMEIESIIDDGLFIYNGNILAGTSAKRQDTKIGAIKTALFTLDSHRETVAMKIKQINPQKVLVIGTSDRMVFKIVERLGLTEIEKIIYIEEITTDGQREIARKQRQQLGKHVIPAPALQLKKEFSGYFMYPLKIFKGFGTAKPNISEKSVVRPTYSYLGGFEIAPKVISDIALYVSNNNEYVYFTHKIHLNETKTGISIKAVVTMKYGNNIVEGAKSLQRDISSRLEQMTSLNVEATHIEIRNLR